MPVTREQIADMRTQLAADRELCANSETAQAFLNLAESKLDEVETGWARLNPAEALDHVLSEIESNQIGKDSATGDEIPELADDIRTWETAPQTVPLENRDLPLFKIAEKSIALLKKNCIALADKSDLQDRMISVFERTKNLRAELDDVDRLIQENSDLNLGATVKVFQHFRDSLTPTLDSVLNKSLGDILAARP